MSTFASVDEYLAAQPAAAQSSLREIRAIIRAALPGAAEVISYGVPTYKLGGRSVVHFGAAKKHCALYGAAMEQFADELKGYDTSKGTVRFPLDQPLPAELVQRLVQARLAQHQARGKR